MADNQHFPPIAGRDLAVAKSTGVECCFRFHWCRPPLFVHVVEIERGPGATKFRTVRANIAGEGRAFANARIDMDRRTAIRSATMLAVSMARV